MQSNEAWWSKSADPSMGTADPSMNAADPLMSTPEPAETPRVDDPAFDGESIGEQIDRAIGSFDARLARLREELDDNRVRTKSLQKEIGEIERDQAKAMKELLNTNPRIREMLGPKAKAAKGRKKTTKKADA